MKIDIFYYQWADVDSMLRRFVDMYDAIRTRHIVDEQMQPAFAQSNLSGR